MQSIIDEIFTWNETRTAPHKIIRIQQTPGGTGWGIYLNPSINKSSKQQDQLKKAKSIKNVKKKKKKKKGLWPHH